MWLHVPGMFLAHAQELEDLTLPSSSPSTAEPELYVTSSEKAMLRPLSWHGWRRRHWLTLLFGTVSKPSTADLGADLWICSLRVSRANPLPSPAGARVPAMSDGCGTTLQGYFARFDPQSSCWRTSQGSLLSTTDSPLPVFSEPWPNSGTLRNGVCFQRRRWAPAIDVSDSSSWPTPTSLDSGGNRSSYQGAPYRPSLRRINGLWMSPKAEDSQASGNHPHAKGGGDTLTGQSKQWMTPNASLTGTNKNAGGTKSTRDAPQLGLMDQAIRMWSSPTVADAESDSPTMRPSRQATGRTTDYLGRQATMWQTPQAADANGEGREPRLKRGELIRPDESRDLETPGSYRSDLKDQASMWQSPVVSQSQRNLSELDPDLQKRADTKRTIDLATQSSHWQTPRAADAHGAGYQRDHGIKGRERLSLTGEAKQWPSPQARDYRDGRSNRVDLTHSPDLNTVVETYLQPLSANSQSSHLDPTIEKDGLASLKSRPRLNRLFVEWLMNWPIGWTSFGFVETEYSRWLEQSRYMFLVLVSASSGTKESE